MSNRFETIAFAVLLSAVVASAALVNTCGADVIHLEAQLYPPGHAEEFKTPNLRIDLVYHPDDPTTILEGRGNWWAEDHLHGSIVQVTGTWDPAAGSGSISGGTCLGEERCALTVWNAGIPIELTLADGLLDGSAWIPDEDTRYAHQPPSMRRYDFAAWTVTDVSYAVPEPTSAACWAVGLVGLVARARRWVDAQEREAMQWASIQTRM